MDEKEFIKIIDKYLSGEATAEETRLVRSYLKLLEESAEEKIYNEEFGFIKEEIKNSLWCEIEVNERDLQKRKRNRFKQWSVAASLIFLLSFVGYLVDHNEQIVSLSDKTVQIYDVEPGGDKAQLILNDGRIINLDKLQVGEFPNQQEGLVFKVKDGLLEYSDRDNLDSKEEIITNTLVTPKGARYSVVLSDGSKVWLNANSSLTFPVAFSGKERRVELKGEGYFEISENKKMPFIVSSDKIEVEVLGTHFNLMDYEDEETSQTTLLEGAVKITDKNKSIFLSPMQQAKHTGTVGFSVSQVETTQAIAWKKGYFDFQEESLEQIMRKISRWYDVDVEYQDNFSHLKFGGKVSNSKPLSAILEMISLAGNVNFNIKERKVVVMK